MKATPLAIVVLAALLFAPGPSAAQDADDYRTVCEQGDLFSCTVVGLIYETGSGEDRDPELAIAYYQLACAGGEMTGCTNRGLLHENAIGGPKDLDLAADRYRFACDGGEPLACDLLGALESPNRLTDERSYFKAGRVGAADEVAWLSGALVEVPQFGIQVLTDDWGRVTLGQFPEGYYDVKAEAVGYQAVRGRLSVPGNAEFMILLEPATLGAMDAPGRIDGYVTDLAHLGLAGVDVTVVGQEEVAGQSDEVGRFTLRNVRPGLVEVRFSRMGYETWTTMLIVQPGLAAQVAAALSADAPGRDP